MWYALRVTYARELKVQRLLAQMGIESYIPMRTVESTLFGKVCRREVAAIHNLLFVYIPKAQLKEIKGSTDMPIRYIMDKTSQQPIIIPQEQMQCFMQVMRADSEFAEIVPIEEISYKEGENVEVVGGPFCGIFGRYIRYKGHSKVVVELNGIAAALTAYIPARYIRHINQE